MDEYGIDLKGWTRQKYSKDHRSKFPALSVQQIGQKWAIWMVLEPLGTILILLELFRAIFRTEREWYFNLWSSQNVFCGTFVGQLDSCHQVFVSNENHPDFMDE